MTDAYAGIVAALEARDAWTGDPAHAKCPAHDDHRGSLSVKHGRDGAVIKCHVGCATENVMAALGLTMADLYDDNSSRRNGDGIEATYVYEDETGAPLFEVVRLSGKRFRPRLPGADRFGIGDTRRVPFRLPRVIEAVQASRIVYSPEGEKDVQAFEAHGEVATCNPFGAGKWTDDLSEWLRGAFVFVVADRDDAGYDHARKVRASLERVGATVVIREAKTGKDASDHFAAGHGVEDFVTWVDGEPPGSDDVSHRPTPLRETGHGTARFTTRPVDLTQLRPVRFMWRPWLIHGRLNLFVGEEASGKSTLQGWLAAQLTRGTLPGECNGAPGDALWVGADEDDWYEIVTPRLYAAGADLSHVREFVPTDDTAVFNVVDDIAELDRELRAHPFALVVFEQLMDVLPKMNNPNDPVEIRRALRPLRRMLAARDVTGIGTLHVNKTLADRLRQRMQGSMQFGALSRSTVLVDRHPDDEDRRVAVLGKANYVANPVAMSFRIDSHPFDLNGREFDVGRVADVQDDDATVEDVLAQGRGERERKHD